MRVRFVWFRVHRASAGSCVAVQKPTDSSDRADKTDKTTSVGGCRCHRWPPHRHKRPTTTATRSSNDHTQRAVDIFTDVPLRWWVPLVGMSDLHNLNLPDTRSRA